MKSIKISETTYERLVGLKRGNETFNDAIDKLFTCREEYLDQIAEERVARTSVEADRATDR